MNELTVTIESIKRKAVYIATATPELEKIIKQFGFAYDSLENLIIYETDPSCTMSKGDTTIYGLFEALELALDENEVNPEQIINELKLYEITHYDEETDTQTLSEQIHLQIN